MSEIKGDHHELWLFKLAQLIIVLQFAAEGRE